MGRRAGVVTLVAVLGLWVGGCKLTRQNYHAVSLGASGEEAKVILGAPRYEFAGEWVYTRDDPRDLTKVSIYLDEGGRVVGKCWRNPEKPWENDREGNVPQP